MSHSGTLEAVRAAIFASKEDRRGIDANASPEEKLVALEAMQELAEEFKRARATLRPAPAPGGEPLKPSPR